MSGLRVRLTRTISCPPCVDAEGGDVGFIVMAGTCGLLEAVAAGGRQAPGFDGAELGRISERAHAVVLFDEAIVWRLAGGEENVDFDETLEPVEPWRVVDVPLELLAADLGSPAREAT